MPVRRSSLAARRAPLLERITQACPVSPEEVQKRLLIR
jgi:hypothetical protein